LGVFVLQRFELIRREIVFAQNEPRSGNVALKFVIELRIGRPQLRDSPLLPGKQIARLDLAGGWVELVMGVTEAEAFKQPA